MSVHLEAVRFFATTMDEREAGTDDGVLLRYHVDREGPGTPPAGWHTVELNHGWNDRERGRTEMYETDFSPGEDIEVIISGTHVGGIRFRDFDEAMRQRFQLVMQGDDAWKIDHYYLLGRFTELDPLPGTSESRRIEHGWLLIASRERDITLSTDPDEGIRVHEIRLNVNPQHPQTRA